MKDTIFLIFICNNKKKKKKKILYNLFLII